MPAKNEKHQILHLMKTIQKNQVVKLDSIVLLHDISILTGFVQRPSLLLFKLKPIMGWCFSVPRPLSSIVSGFFCL